MKRADAGFWRGRRVLVTGHTGFKGGWLALRLAALGAEATGLALDPPTNPSLFALAGVGEALADRRGDIRDAGAMTAAIAAARPQVVFHLAAQPLVRAGLAEPIGTLETNVMGTAVVLEALRGAGAAAIVVVTSDKVYRNDERGHAFAEDDPLGGADPYSGSKSAAEMVARLYRESFGLPVATARAGNVVGGGDFAADRLLPDVWRARAAGAPLVLRRPAATRPWGHVLDVIEGYLLFAEALAAGDAPAALNFGPAADAPALSVLETAEIFAEALGGRLDWRGEPAPFAEKSELAIDSAAARAALGWSERLPGAAGVRAAARWYARLAAGDDMATLSRAAAHAGLEAAA
ncbi:MAG TPA: CDP-glucose 4,6-dehydratase [Caulobacteraceae bacterium]|nr:CDP-glucose 4,6-dehydratase [Caulobacteraceae bacterium]